MTAVTTSTKTICPVSIPPKLKKVWWRRWESNPRPKAFGCRIYMLIRFLFCHPNQANKSGNNTCLNVPQSFSQRSPEGNRMAEKPAKATSYPFRGLSEFDGCVLITQRVVTVRWQLFLFATDLRGCGTSACIYSLNYSRRSQSPPNYLSSIPSRTTQLQ